MPRCGFPAFRTELGAPKLWRYVSTFRTGSARKEQFKAQATDYGGLVRNCHVKRHRERQRSECTSTWNGSEERENRGERGEGTSSGWTMEGEQGGRRRNRINEEIAAGGGGRGEGEGDCFQSNKNPRLPGEGGRREARARSDSPLFLPILVVSFPSLQVPAPPY